MTIDKKRWRMREGTRDDAPNINRLFVETMGMERSMEHDIWKFWDNPFGTPHVILAEDGSRIVGQYALWPTPLRFGKEDVVGAQSLDTMTHPEYQGQGMFTTLANACFELARSRGCDALYGFPNHSSYPGFVRRLNWDHTGDVPAYTRLIRPSRHPRFAGVAGPVVDAASRLLPRGSSRGMEVVWTRPPAEAMPSVIAQVSAEKDVCRISRTPAWYEWRFAAESGRKYEWVTALRNGEVVGWAVWGRDILVSYSRGLLAELIGTDRDVLVALVSSVVTRATELSVSILNAVTSIPEQGAALRRCGFFQHTKVPLIVRGLTPRTLGANMHDHASWRVFGADLDTF